MAAISSVSSAQSAAQAGWQQLRLQQAKRNAEQAVQAARALEVQAADAQQAADRAQGVAGALAVKSDEAQGRAGQAQQGLAVIKSVSQMQTQLSNTVDQVVERQRSVLPDETTKASLSVNSVKVAPVVNTQGQLTGRVVNVSA